MKRQPVQSMWMFTIDVGLAIKASANDSGRRQTGAEDGAEDEGHRFFKRLR